MQHPVKSRDTLSLAQRYDWSGRICPGSGKGTRSIITFPHASIIAIWLNSDLVLFYQAEILRKAYNIP